MSNARTADIRRDTAETKIEIGIDLDGSGMGEISTGIGFFDHMLDLFVRHSLVDAKIQALGDIEVDFHHTVEDVGIVLGQCFREALGDKKGIRRYGWCLLPMDETLCRVALDFSGRPFLAYRVPDGVGDAGAFPVQLVEEFMRAFSNNAAANLHIEILSGRDGHHVAESIFKGLAKAVDQAVSINPRVAGQIPSTKEVL